jgi:damage-control phosphatase, subfamily I
MKATPECVACMFKQALNTAKVASEDQDAQLKVLRRVGDWATRLSLDQTPAQMCKHVYQAVSEITGVSDPYQAIKETTNRQAMELLPFLRRKMERSSDRLSAALHMAAAGNVIDFGIHHDFELERDIEGILEQRFTIDDTELLRKDMKPDCRILYLGDNAGEIVFDTILVSELIAMGANVVYTVKSGPVINDATMEDAEKTGMTAITKVIKTGADDIGVNWQNVSQEFRDHVSKADIILAKGHGNYETCEDQPGNYYFLLKSKCDIVANALGVKFGDLVFKKKRIQ